eukprot:GILK01008566.1.p1 GENE.GILK01008566.1~~GILK01008566.1.p1  ORF type:complete len:382 (-),score=81.76 GILK01008566.1:101-1198(-)
MAAAAPASSVYVHTRPAPRPVPVGLAESHKPPIPTIPTIPTVPSIPTMPVEVGSLVSEHTISSSSFSSSTNSTSSSSDSTTTSTSTSSSGAASLVPGTASSLSSTSAESQSSSIGPVTVDSKMDSAAGSTGHTQVSVAPGSDKIHADNISSSSSSHSLPGSQVTEFLTRLRREGVRKTMASMEESDRALLESLLADTSSLPSSSNSQGKDTTIEAPILSHNTTNSHNNINTTNTYPLLTRQDLHSPQPIMRDDDHGETRQSNHIESAQREATTPRFVAIQSSSRHLASNDHDKDTPLLAGKSDRPDLSLEPILNVSVESQTNVGYAAEVFRTNSRTIERFELQKKEFLASQKQFQRSHSPNRLRL